MKIFIRLVALFSLVLVSASVAHVRENDIGNSEIQQLRSMLGTLQVIDSTLGIMIAQPLPTTYANDPVKTAAWNKQTSCYQKITWTLKDRMKTLTGIVRDNQVTEAEYAQVNGWKWSSMICPNDTQADNSPNNPMRKRHETGHTLFQALTRNEQ